MVRSWQKNNNIYIYSYDSAFFPFILALFFSFKSTLVRPTKTMEVPGQIVWNRAVFIMIIIIIIIIIIKCQKLNFLYLGIWFSGVPMLGFENKEFFGFHVRGA